MAHDVFISHSHEEADIAESVVEGLEKKNIKCWISSRDIPAGSDYAEQIMYGINNSRIVVLILSSNTCKSPHVIRELNRALTKKIEILPFRIEDFELSASMEYYVSTAHWFNALTPDLEKHIDDLAIHIQKIFDKQKKDKIKQAIVSAKAFFKDKNYIEARKHFQIVIELDSEHKDAVHYLNEIERLEREIAEELENSITLCKKALEAKKPNQARVYINKALELDKDNAEAIALEKEVQKLEQDRIKVIAQSIEVGKKALDSGNYNQAIKYFKEVLELDRDNQEVSNLLNESEKFEADKQKRIIELLALGTKELEAGNYTGSIKHFRNVLELEKDNREALTNLTKISQLDKSRKLKIAETLTLAKRLHKLNFKNKARDLYEEVLRLDPENKTALRALSELQPRTIPSTKKKRLLNLKMVAAGIGVIVIVVAISAWLNSRPGRVSQQPEPVETNITESAEIEKRLEMVIDSIENKDLSRAQTFINEIIKEAPDNFTAQELSTEILKLTNEVSQLANLGIEAQSKDKYLKARQYYVDILEIDKKNANAHEMLESIEKYLQEKEKYLLLTAKKSLDDKRITEAKIQYTEVLDLNTKNEKAKDALSKISGIEKQIAFFNKKGKDALKKEDYNSARENFKKVLDLDRKNIEALKAIKEIKPLPSPAEYKPLALMLKDKKLEFFQDSEKRLYFGEIKMNQTINRNVKFKSYLDQKIEFGLFGCNWMSKKHPLGRKPIELFDSQLLILRPNESGTLQISLTMFEDTKLPVGKYTGELLFKDLNSADIYKFKFDFTLIQ
jgi:tetratricopeptide (TPR) repeat protein